MKLVPYHYYYMHRHPSDQEGPKGVSHLGEVTSRGFYKQTNQRLGWQRGKKVWLRIDRVLIFSKFCDEENSSDEMFLLLHLLIGWCRRRLHTNYPSCTKSTDGGFFLEHGQPRHVDLEFFLTGNLLSPAP